MTYMTATTPFAHTLYATLIAGPYGGQLLLVVACSPLYTLDVCAVGGGAGNWVRMHQSNPYAYRVLILLQVFFAARK